MMQNKEKSKSKPYGMPIITGYVLMRVFACWGKMSIDRLKVHETEPNFQRENRRQDPVPGKWIAFEKEGCLFFWNWQEGGMPRCWYRYISQRVGRYLKKVLPDEFYFSRKGKHNNLVNVKLWALRTYKL